MMKIQAVLTMVLCMGVALGASAQEKLVKDVERATKKNYKEALKQMQPAFTNPETANSAYPRFVVGTAGFQQYDDQFGRKQLGLTDVAEVDMADNLMGGYQYMLEALQMDTVTDAKGKVKTKFSKKIVDEITGHAADFNNAAVYYWTAENYKGAYDAWQSYLDVVADPRFPVAVPADSLLQNTIFNQALAAYNLQDMNKALDRFMAIMSVGPAKKHVYDYALSVAQGMDASDTIMAICEQAQPLYGDQDPIYLINVVNVLNKRKQYDEANKKLDDALAANCSDTIKAQLWRVKGYLYEYQEKPDEALQYYKKAVETNPGFALGLYDYARNIFNAGMRLEEATSNADYARVRREQLIPMYNQAKEIIDQAMTVAGEDASTVDQLEQLMDNVKYKLDQE